MEMSHSATDMTCFLNAKGAVNLEFIPSGQIVNQTFYLEDSRRLRNSDRQKRPDLWQIGDWFFH